MLGSITAALAAARTLAKSLHGELVFHTNIGLRNIIHRSTVARPVARLMQTVDCWSSSSRSCSDTSKHTWSQIKLNSNCAGPAKSGQVQSCVAAVDLQQWQLASPVAATEAAILAHGESQGFKAPAGTVDHRHLCNVVSLLLSHGELS